MVAVTTVTIVTIVTIVTNSFLGCMYVRGTVVAKFC